MFEGQSCLCSHSTRHILQGDKLVQSALFSPCLHCGMAEGPDAPEDLMMILARAYAYRCAELIQRQTACLPSGQQKLCRQPIAVPISLRGCQMCPKHGQQQDSSCSANSVATGDD